MPPWLAPVPSSPDRRGTEVMEWEVTSWRTWRLCRGAPWQPLSPSCRTLATTTQHLSLEEGQRRLQEVLPADRRILQALSRPTLVGSSEAQGTAPQAQSQAASPSRLSSRPSSPLPSTPWHRPLQQQRLSSILLCHLAMLTSTEGSVAWELNWRPMDRVYRQRRDIQQLTQESLLPLWLDQPTLLSSRNKRMDQVLPAMATAMGTP